MGWIPLNFVQPSKRTWGVESNHGPWIPKKNVNLITWLYPIWSSFQRHLETNGRNARLGFLHTHLAREGTLSRLGRATEEKPDSTAFNWFHALIVLAHSHHSSTFLASRSPQYTACTSVPCIPSLSHQLHAHCGISNDTLCLFYRRQHTRLVTDSRCLLLWEVNSHNVVPPLNRACFLSEWWHLRLGKYFLPGNETNS